MVPALFEGIPSELIDRFESGGPSALAFPPAVNGHRLTSSQYAELLQGLGTRGGEPLALYIQVPFCPVRCLFCACHTTVTHDAERIDRYLDVLETEMDLVVRRLGVGKEVCQLQVGGGTPNYLSDAQLVRLMGMVEQRFRIREDADVGIECNPRRASASQLELLRSLGFKRISLGVQDLDPTVQQAIGRINSLDLIRDVHWTARDLGFETTTLELVYGLPRQTPAGFARTLEQIVALDPDRIACFGYSHQPSKRPHQFAIDAESVPSSADKLTLLHEAVSMLTSTGYQWIGMDHFAREGDPLTAAQSEHALHHNCIGYTSAPSRHLVALGMASLGEVDGALVQNNTDLNGWGKAVDQGQFPISWGQLMSEHDQRCRTAMRHLMCNLELPASLAEGMEPEYQRLCRGAEHGLMEVTPDGVRVTPRGRYFLRSLCSEQDATLAWNSGQWGVPGLS
jgi:oxygen-independent coproporphyrinogen-3 oxidase